MRNAKDASAVYLTGELSQPCSTAGSIHHECGGWFLASVLQPCTYSYAKTCKVGWPVFVRHTGVALYPGLVCSCVYVKPNGFLLSCVCFYV